MSKRSLVIVLIVLAAVNTVAWLMPVRWDLTDDKRYSLSQASKQLLRQTDQPVIVTLFLDGDLNAGFQRLKRATQETLEEMAVYAPLTVHQEHVTSQIADTLGIKPIVIHEREHNGKTAQTTVYPYALLRYNGKKAVVQLLRNTRGLSGEENLNASIEQLEFAFMEALSLLQQTRTPRVAFIEGHGETDEPHTFDFMNALSRYFQVDRGQMGNDLHVLDAYRAVIIADPQTPFNDTEKYILDQYIMRGGTVLWALNGVRLSRDILRQEGFTPVLPLDLGITEMLFRYGVRINPALVQDIQCLPIPVNVSTDPSQTNLQPMPWTFAPLLLTSQASPITKDLGQVMSTFVSPVDAVGGDDGIEKRILLATSTASRVTATPGEVDLSDMNPDMEQFRYQYVPVALSLEGVFSSAYAHRMAPEGLITDEPIRKQSVHTRQVIVASGSVLSNEMLRNQPLPMGYDRYSGMQFSNRDWAVNAVLWLTDAEGLISLREKEITLRLINDQRAHRQRTNVQLVSTISPIAILALIGAIVMMVRKRKYQTA